MSSIAGWTQETACAGVEILGPPAGPEAQTPVGTQDHAHLEKLDADLLEAACTQGSCSPTRARPWNLQDLTSPPPTTLGASGLKT